MWLARMGETSMYRYMLERQLWKLFVIWIRLQLLQLDSDQVLDSDKASQKQRLFVTLNLANQQTVQHQQSHQLNNHSSSLITMSPLANHYTYASCDTIESVVGKCTFWFNNFCLSHHCFWKIIFNSEVFSAAQYYIIHTNKIHKVIVYVLS